jgi:hypothetical protein
LDGYSPVNEKMPAILEPQPTRISMSMQATITIRSADGEPKTIYPSLASILDMPRPESGNPSPKLLSVPVPEVSHEPLSANEIVLEESKGKLYRLGLLLQQLQDEFGIRINYDARLAEMEVFVKGTWSRTDAVAAIQEVTKVLPTVEDREWGLTQERCQKTYDRILQLAARLLGGPWSDLLANPDRYANMTPAELKASLGSYYNQRDLDQISSGGKIQFNFALRWNQMRADRDYQSSQSMGLTRP